MAQKVLTITPVNLGNNNAFIGSWAAMGSADTVDPWQTVSNADRSVQVEGTFGAGGTMSLYGSNDGTNYHILSNPQGDPLTFTAAGLMQISEITRYIKPASGGGDGTTALVVTVLVSSTRQGQ